MSTAIRELGAGDLAHVREVVIRAIGAPPPGCVGRIPLWPAS